MADINLSQQDIDYIARVVDTEVPGHLARTNPAEYERMVQGVVDTVTNRMQSERYPSTAVGVLNQPRQFSQITGPARLGPYGSVQNAPKASALAQNAVYDYAAARAQGAPPTVGGALSYANPNFSDRRNLTGWIDPMIDAGAKALGIGRNVHYHGTVPGQEPAGFYTVAVEGMPSGPVPTPTPRDQISPAYGLMGAIDPIAPMAVERGGLLGPATVAPTTFQDVEVSKSARNAPQGFDASRVGPSPSAFKETPVAAFAPAATPAAQTASFDMGRFGPEVVGPTAPSSFDTARFGAPPVGPTPSNPSVASLQRGLLDQTRAVYGALPDIPPEVAPGALLGQPPVDPTVTATPAVPGYVDPRVTTQPQAAPSYTAQPSYTPQNAQPALSMAQQTYNQRASMAAPAPSAMGQQMARDVQRQMSTRNTLGGIGGALLGGAILGPVGGLLGGMLGRNYAQRTYHPPAPEPVRGQPASRDGTGGTGYSGLNSYGREAYSSSGDFKDSVDKGGVGLY